MANNHKIWTATPNGAIFAASPVTEVKINPGIYQLKNDPMKGIFLERISTQFTVPSKIYGMDSRFIERTIKTYQNSSKNVGVLLNGLKGSGKTVTAKLICNKLNLPVICISENCPGLPEFIHQINFDCVILIDEYEKIFVRDDRGVLLSCMDGAQMADAKVLYLLTTNNLYLNENMLNRPSRIRYIRSYEDVPRATVIEILSDRLNDKKLFEASLRTIAQLRNITVDLLIEIIDEINLHEEEPAKFIGEFNCNRETYGETYRKYNIIDADDPTKIYFIDRKIRGYISPTTSVGMTYSDEDGYNIVNVISRYSDTALTVSLLNPEYVKYVTDNKIDEYDATSNDFEGSENAPPQYITANVVFVIQEKSMNWQFRGDF